MILDIRYTDKAPEQIQRVRLYTLYTERISLTLKSEIVIHFYEGGQRNISVDTIETVMVSND